MFICLDCGNVFDEPATYVEHHPYGSGYADEEFCVCPYCRGDCAPAIQCEQCGEYYIEEEMHNSIICSTCALENRKSIAKAIASLFTKEEFDNLPDDTFDDIWNDVEKIYKEEEVEKQ